MSTEEIQPDGLGPTAGFYTVALPKSVDSVSSCVTRRSGSSPLLIVQNRRFDFMKLPVEILTTILSEMAAAQLPLFRSLCRAAHDFVTANEHGIVFSALKKDLYRTASKLYYRHIYYPRPQPNILHVDDLYQVARRCDSARALAFLLAQDHFMDLIRTSEHTGVAPNHACCVKKVAENIYPYIIGLFHFLEKYRHALATFVADTRYTNSIRTPGSQIERRLLAQYNKETVYRLCCLYHLLMKIAHQRLPQSNLVTMSMILRLSSPAGCIQPDASYLDLFIFGGLEAFRDVVAQTSVSARVDYLLAHYNKVTPITLPVKYKRRSHATLVPLPKPILPELGHQTAIDTYRRLPFTELILDLANAGLWGYDWGLQQRIEEGKFLGYLATHEGAEPKLLR